MNVLSSLAMDIYKKICHKSVLINNPMNSPKNPPESPISQVHEEVYEEKHIFDLRQRRLEDLGYTMALKVNIPLNVEPANHTRDVINLLQEHNREIVQISFNRIYLIFQRSPDSPFLSAKDDFDAPAGLNNVTLFAIAQIMDRTKKKLS